MSFGNILFTFWQCTFGCLQTAAGAVLYLALKKRPHFTYRGACVTYWKKTTSLSLGKFIFLAENQTDGRLLVHEYGHCIQSAILGPLYLPIIGLPSVIWCNVPYFEKRRKEKDISYYSLYCERWANHLGERVTKERSVGQPKPHASFSSQSGRKMI